MTEHQTIAAPDAAARPWFFGYGSLVNRQTHTYPDSRPAELAGYRRCWVNGRGRKYTFLSVEPDAATTILGVIASVPNADWLALDEREAAYARHDVSLLTRHNLGAEVPIATYRAMEPEPVRTERPILLSYVDTVAQGFHDIYGPPGIPHFFATTVSWGPVLDDRAAPVYARATGCTPWIAETVDDTLRKLGIAVMA